MWAPPTGGEDHVNHQPGAGDRLLCSPLWWHFTVTSLEQRDTSVIEGSLMMELSSLWWVAAKKFWGQIIKPLGVPKVTSRGQLPIIYIFRARL